jgi:mRNA interferase RelE/StbE
MAYTVRLKPRAEAELDKLPLATVRRITAKLLALEEEPRPQGSIKLEGTDGYRIRIGDYRVVYLVNDRERLVEIVRIAHRREVYR